LTKVGRSRHEEILKENEERNVKLRMEGKW